MQVGIFNKENGLHARPKSQALFPAPIPEIERRTANLLREGSGGPHVVNLGHGILPMIPVDHARAFVEAVERTPTP
ncbi:MAG TPA: uroporphyrinogen decarboxylase family protein [Thermoanaerobaculia bacterium]|nr:uroporphyrinogen decarboxylase family protein [Thermoanaerobaculia bacterium]